MLRIQRGLIFPKRKQMTVMKSSTWLTIKLMSTFLLISWTDVQHFAYHIIEWCAFAYFISLCLNGIFWSFPYYGNTSLSSCPLCLVLQLILMPNCSDTTIILAVFYIIATANTICTFSKSKYKDTNIQMTKSLAIISNRTEGGIKTFTKSSLHMSLFP